MFDHRVGLQDKDREDHVLQLARRTYAKPREALESIISAEKTIRADRTKNRVDHDLRVHKLATKAKDEHLAASLKASDEVKRAIDEINATFDKGFRSRQTEKQAEEIRRHIKELKSKEDRRAFMGSADEDVVAAVLSSKPFLCGLSDTDVVAIRHAAEKRWFPDLVARRQKLTTANEMLDEIYHAGIRELNNFISPDADKTEELARQADLAAKGLPPAPH
ncbi:hypothetical protein ATO7_12128 [Oceanococcus atlanticus]|uniref:Uncharacterized protein n=2 Tax=Oceanococcus atlanticus TaxID=1317117 RepID=A0A1Y1SBN8_9GAMM|nr:hypothetical protein ATO7_12128 [Oceanococcus atlanticus]